MSIITSVTVAVDRGLGSKSVLLAMVPLANVAMAVGTSHSSFVDYH